MRKFYFTNRVVDQWNSLPNWVATANNTKIFLKNDLINIGNIRILYLTFEHNYIEGTGSRSEVSRVNIV